MAKRGRPRGANINPSAIDDLLKIRAMQKGELCEASDITPGHFADMMRRQKGANLATIRKMAAALRCSPETVAPELSGLFIAIRRGDANSEDES